MEGYSEAPHRVAGHDGVLVDDSGLLFIKPVHRQELKFYTQINDETFLNKNGQDIDEDQLRDWTPKFMGTLESGISDQAAQSKEITMDLKKLYLDSKEDTKLSYIVLENLLNGFKNPSVIDIKLGSILTDDRASEEKKKRLAEVSKKTTSGSHNFRVCGMKLFNKEMPNLEKFDDVKENVVKDDKGYLNFDKWYGRKLNDSTLGENFKLFFLHNKLNLEQQQIVIRNTFTRLQLLYNCLISQEVRMRSSSLLIAYENDLERWESLQDNDPIYRDEEDDDEDEEDDEDETSEEDEEPAKHVNKSLSFLTLIDFAHSEVTPGKGHDEDVIKGVENLINEIEKLIIE